MKGYTAIPLTCSRCNKQGTYTMGWGEDEIVCVNGPCGNTIHYVDLELDPGEVVNFNADNVLCVFTPDEPLDEQGNLVGNKYRRL